MTRVVGFALATRGSPAADDPDDLDVAEFFVIRPGTPHAWRQLWYHQADSIAADSAAVMKTWVTSPAEAGVLLEVSPVSVA